MASQQATLGKFTNNPSTYSILHLGNNPQNLPRSGVQFVTNQPGISVPIKIPSTAPNLNVSDSARIPLQLSSSNISFLSSVNSGNVPLNSQKQILRTASSVPILANVRNSGNSLYQLQMAANHNVNLDKDDTDGSRLISQRFDQTTVTPVPNKSQDPVGFSLVTGQRLIPNTSGSSVQISVSQPNKSSNGLCYISKPNSYKPNSSDASVAPPSLASPIIVRKSLGPGLQFLSPALTKTPLTNKATSITKCATIAPKVSSQSVIIQKSGKIPSNILQVPLTGKSVIPMPPLASIKKVANTQDNTSLLVSATNLTMSSANNSKIMYQKVNNNKIVLPIGMNSNMTTPSINFQVNNQDESPTNLSTTDNVFPVPKTTPRAEAISDQEYSLSIPDTNDSMNDDVYTVSISDDAINPTEKSFTIPVFEKAKSLIKSSMNDQMNPQDLDGLNMGMSSIPAILRRSNAESNEKKIIPSRRRISNVDSNSRLDLAKSRTLYETAVSLHDKFKFGLSGEHNKALSLICSEELSIDIDTKAQIKKELPALTIEKTKPLLTMVPQQSVSVSKDRRKNRMSSDVNHTNEVDKNMESHAFKSDKSIKRKDPGFEFTLNDAPGLNWNNGVAHLSGSDLKFHVNEFGVIDVLDKKSENGTYGARNNFNNREKKLKSPDDLYSCRECGCHGMASDFVSPNFCSKSCQVTYERIPKFKREKALTDLKKRKKPKKLKEQKRSIKDQSDYREVESAMQDEPPVEEYINRNLEEITLSKKNSWISTSGFSWIKYLEYCKAYPVPDKFFKDISVNKNGFRRGMKLEAIDPAHPSVFAVVTISNIQGHRLCLHFDGYGDEYDFWVNLDSCDIFPAGWCEKNKRALKTPAGYDQQSFSWNLYLRQHKAIAAPKNLFQHLPDLHPCPNGFRVGMKLEAEDRKNSLTCVATVADVINNRILIHFDSWDDIYDYWVDPTSPYIHPVGWCDENNFSLTPPHTYKDPESFSWEEYLCNTGASAVPARAFKPRLPHKFKIGMKLEAVDKRVPFLIRVATVTDVRRHQVRITFDGWPDNFSYWLDDDSPDIHPVNWCLKTGHSLEPPLIYEESLVPGECGTNGCRGLGNVSFPKRSTHRSSEDCPYRSPEMSPQHRDRLEDIRYPPELSEPRTREPRKNMPIVKSASDSYEIRNNLVIDYSDRSADVREQQQAKRRHDEDASDEDYSSQLKRKRAISPLTQDKVEFSVYEPGYLPNPSKVTPPYWGRNSTPLKEILERVSVRVDPRNWNQSEVLKFVEIVTDGSKFSCAFSKHCIDGESFLMLSQEDLVGMLDIKLGPAMKIYNSIVQLRQRILS